VIVRVVNKGKVGEPEYIVYQNQETKQIIEPSDITRVLRGGEYEEPDIDGNLQYVLNHMNHICEIQINSDEYTLILK